MKIKEGFVLKTIAGRTVAVPVGDNLGNLQLMLTLNESGAFLWKELENECTEDMLVEAIKTYQKRERRFGGLVQK